MDGIEYTVYVVSDTLLDLEHGAPLRQPSQIHTIYVIDENGVIVTDRGLAEEIITLCESEAILVHNIKDAHLHLPILTDLDADLLTDNSGIGYLVIGPACTYEWWRDLWLYNGAFSVGGLNEYDHRVAIWTDVLMECALQPGLHDGPEDDPALHAKLEIGHRLMNAAALATAASSAIVQGDRVFRLSTETIQTTLLNYRSITTRASAVRFLDRAALALGVASKALEIGADAAQLVFLHAIANADAADRLHALCNYVKSNAHALDPALIAATYSAEAEFKELCDTYYEGLGGVLASLSQGDDLIDLALLTGQLAAVLKNAPWGRVILPYYFSWEIWKGLRDLSHEAQRAALASTLQRHLSGVTIADGLADQRDSLASSASNDAEYVRETLELFNVNWYLGYYFSTALREILGSSIYGIVNEFLALPDIDGYNKHLDEQKAQAALNTQQTAGPAYLANWEWGGLSIRGSLA